jgi:hypothetical protein
MHKLPVSPLDPPHVPADTSLPRSAAGASCRHTTTCYDVIANRAGSTLDRPAAGPKNGVHLTLSAIVAPADEERLPAPPTAQPIKHPACIHPRADGGEVDERFGIGECARVRPSAVVPVWARGSARAHTSFSARWSVPKLAAPREFPACRTTQREHRQRPPWRPSRRLARLEIDPTSRAKPARRAPVVVVLMPDNLTLDLRNHRNVPPSTAAGDHWPDNRQGVQTKRGTRV